MSHLALVILGGNIKKNGRGNWQTTTFKEGDAYGALGDRLRVIAAKYEYDDDGDARIFALGGRGQLEGVEGVPAISEVIKNELVQRGVPEDRISVETVSGSTFQQLQELKRIISDKAYDEYRVLSNRYHLPRVQAMIESDHELAQAFRDNVITLCSAEESIIEHEPKWKDEIDKAYATDQMEQRIAVEQEGVRQIQEGKYRFR